MPRKLEKESERERDWKGKEDGERGWRLTKLGVGEKPEAWQDWALKKKSDEIAKTEEQPFESFTRYSNSERLPFFFFGRLLVVHQKKKNSFLGTV